VRGGKGESQLWICGWFFDFQVNREGGARSLGGGGRLEVAGKKSVEGGNTR